MTSAGAAEYVRPFLEVVVLDAVAASLRARGQRVVRLDASGWTEDADLHRELAAALEFPAHYGANLDALNDSLGDLDVGDGLALAFIGYDGFATHCPRTARIALEIIAEHCAEAAVHGRQLSCLVQPPIAWAEA
ncbi:barstar family protein [Catenuloplanes sp. NPDC051500]|uniref:barstar family protein n=1 Tax=Catenuloplanes sp. NPDC051500 TaxID=3363959 RepID=UPI0037BC3FB2